MKEDIDQLFDRIIETNRTFFIKETKNLLFQINKSFAAEKIDQTDLGGQRINFVSDNIFNMYNDNNYNFENNDIKVYALVPPSFFHFLIDFLAPIFLLNEKFYKIKVIVDLSNIIDMNDEYWNKNYLTNNLNDSENFFARYLINFLKNIFNVNNINYVILNRHSCVKVNNCYYIGSGFTSSTEINQIYDKCMPLIKQKNIIPFRKVYLSRKNYFNDIHISQSTVSDETSISKVNNEKELEKFLIKNNFEIIIPEEKFKNFEDQIQYMYETKLLLSATSSGLLNMIFMQPKGTIIDLQTIFENHIASQYYVNVACLKQHDYIGTPNPLNSKDIIFKINNTEYLKKIVKE